MAGDDIITAPGAGPYQNYGSNWGVGRKPVARPGWGAPGAYAGRPETTEDPTMVIGVPSRKQRPTSDPLKAKGKIRIKYNPPVISYASGAASGGDLLAANIFRGDAGRRDTVGNYSQRERTIKKGYLYPDTTYVDNFDISQSASSSSGYDAALGLSASELRAYREQIGVNTGSSNLLSKTNLLYGFRFQYNPAQILFNATTLDGVDPSFIASGKDVGHATSAIGGGAIEVSVPLTRVDDLRMFRYLTDQERKDYVATGFRRPIISQNELDQLYGRNGSFGMTMDDLYSIDNLGTMYDMEFLFRAALITDFQTIYRKRTADIGFLFGLPLVLRLSDNMRYRVLLTSVGWTHKSFTPDMVPIYTELSLSFERLADITESL